MKFGIQKTYPLSGIWSVTTKEREKMNMRIPGTLAENGIGDPDMSFSDALFPSSFGHFELDFDEDKEEDPVIEGRLTQKYVYEGPVRISKMISFLELPEKRYFLEIERAREVKLLIDEVSVPLFVSPSLVTPWIFEVTGLINGSHMLTIVSDNGYEGLPKEHILDSNMASSDTQTNWNGLLGYVRIREEEQTFIGDVSVSYEKEKANIGVTLYAEEPMNGTLTLSSDAFLEPITKEVFMESPVETVNLQEIALQENVKLWDEGDGEIYDLHVSFMKDEKTVSVGFRSFNEKDGRFILNSRPVMIKGETNEAVFPETVYPPMEESFWQNYFKLLKSYGLNAVYFKSWCPPEAAFSMADALGMMLFPEISSSESVNHDYYDLEIECIQKNYGSHPSLVTLLLGGGKMDFETKPVFGLGQHDMLPDFREIDLYAGVLSPDHLSKMRDTVLKEHLLPAWERAVKASAIEGTRLYRKDLEELLVKPEHPGFFLEGLQDMPGHGLHPHGFLNAHLVPKAVDLAAPDALKKILTPFRALFVTDSFSLSAGQKIKGEVLVRNDEIDHKTTGITWTLTGQGIKKTGELPKKICQRSRLTSFGDLEISIDDMELSFPAELKLMLKTEESSVNYRFYVYENRIPVCPENVYETSILDETALQFLRDGGNVFLTPASGEDRMESGLMVVDDSHPLIKMLPFSADNLEPIDRLLIGMAVPFEKRHKTLIHSWDLQQFDVPEGYFAEFRVLNGNVLLSTLGLKEKMQYPETREILDAIYRYMDSYDFYPREEVAFENLNKAIQRIREVRHG